MQCMQAVGGILVVACGSVVCRPWDVPDTLLAVVLSCLALLQPASGPASDWQPPPVMNKVNISNKKY